MFILPLWPGYRDLGLPLITSYTAQDYDAGTQNWAAVCDHQGLLYVANNKGLLEFDGSQWRLIIIGNNLPVRSVAVNRHNRIYVGALGDFGFLKTDELGSFAFTSLGIGTGIPVETIGDVVTTITMGNEVFFLSSNGLFVYDGRAVTFIAPKSRFHLGFTVLGRLYLRQHGQGLFVLNHKKLDFIAGSEQFAQDRIYAMLPTAKNDEILLASQDHGFFLFYPARDPQERFIPYADLNRHQALFADNKVSICEQMADGAIAFATIKNGLFILSLRGEVVLHLNRQKGLLDDTVYYLYRDWRNNLILCHSMGISYVETGSPFRFIQNASGIGGVGTTAYLPLQNNTGASPLLATYQGLFVGKQNEWGKTEFKSLPLSNQTTHILQKDGQVLVCDDQGVSLFANNRLKRVSEIRMALSMVETATKPQSLIVATFDGLTRIDFKDGQWRSAGVIEGFTQPSFNLNLALDGSYWLHTYSGNGVFRLKLDDDLRRVTKLRNYTSRDGLPADGGNHIIIGRHRILSCTNQGVYRFVPQIDGFEPDPDFPETHQMGVGTELIHEADNGDLWVFGERFAGVYRYRSKVRYQWQSSPYTRLGFFKLGDYFQVWPGNQAILAYQDGFIIFPANLPQPNETQQAFRCLVRRVESPNRVLFAGSFGEQKAEGLSCQSAQDVPILPFARNNIRFYFAAPFLESANQIEFSFQLMGFDKTWSVWSKQTLSSYTNIGEGDYLFQVRARNCYGHISTPAVFKLVVLPPWYRTFWTYVLFSLLGLLLLWTVVKLYTRNLYKEKIRLEEIIIARKQVESQREVALLEREKLQAQLNQAQKMESVGRLAGGVSHDFNNMLGVILGHTEMALEQTDPTHPIFNDLQSIYKAAERSADLTRQLLAFARKQIVTPKVLDLNDTVSGMLNLLRRLIGEDIEIVLKPANNLWPIKMDSSQIDQILANLCVNARDAIAGVGKVTIETQNLSCVETRNNDSVGLIPGEYVLLTVSDDGCGMDHNTQEKLFEPFFTTKEIGKGTGLGLATVFGAIKQNNGFIYVQSKPGQGSTFRIYLPRHLGEVIDHSHASIGKAPMGHGEVILVVEDEQAILKLTSLILQRQGYTVLMANNPTKAIHMAEAHLGEIHLLMTDVIMPQMNGRELAIRLQARYPGMRVLYASGYTADIIAHHGVLNQKVHFIQKPFAMNDLAVKVNEALTLTTSLS